MRALSSICRSGAIVMCLSVVLAGGPALAGGNLGKIMPLGDSITQGAGTWGGYREPLANSLKAAGYTFQFVGSVVDTHTASLIQSGNAHYEGHSGFTISAIRGRDGIDDHLADYIGPGKENPNYILLMIGTNDVATGTADDVQDSINRLSTLITHISNKTTGLRPDAHLIVASIPPIGPNPAILQAGPLVPVFNAGVKTTVQAHHALGENVTFLDVYSHLTVADLGDDQLHPNQGGYDKIAAAWMQGIQAVPEPTTGALLLPMAGLLLKRRQHDVRR